MKYKIKISVVLFFIISVTVFTKDIAVVGFFNTLNLRWSGRNIEQCAQVVSMFDIVGLVEVMSEDRNKINRGCRERAVKAGAYTIRKKQAGNGKYMEYYGFLYRSDKVRMLKEDGFYKKS